MDGFLAGMVRAFDYGGLSVARVLVSKSVSGHPALRPWSRNTLITKKDQL